MKTFLRSLLFLFILLAGIAGLAIYWTFYRPLPDYQTTLEQPALHQEVDIHWDPHGVPHIYANDKHDLYYSMGYVHAQDRLWQMTLSQIAAQGRFAEFFGKQLLPYDKLQRTLGFWRTAKKIEQSLSDSTRAKLQAYADGVNAYVKEHPKSLPIQFTLSDIEPIPWTPTYSVALTRLMAWELNLGWKSELTYNFLSNKLSVSKFNQLLPDNKFVPRMKPDSISKSWAETLMPMLKKNEELRSILGEQGTHVGSNAWAIDAQKSTTGAPLLAGDPHLGLDAPGKWYEVHLHVNGQNLSGATLAGAPIVVLGQNDHLAWSMTNIMLDDTDFFDEAVNPKNKNQYLLDSLAGEPVYSNFKIQKEVVKVKNADDTVLTRRLTNHGPVISDVYPQQKFTKDKVITMKWTGYEVTNEVKALFKMDWAQNFEEFKEGARDFKVPGQNIVYADKDGNIAQLSLADIPIRKGNPLGLRKGWDSSQDWQGYVPFSELPSQVNPDRGWVANANNPPMPADYPYYISIYWEPNSRHERIKQYLSQDQQLSPETFQQMQNDAFSLYARDLTRQILPVLKNSKKYNFETVISYLENWDYSYDDSETAASIMDVFMLRLSQNTFKDEMTDPVYKAFIRFPALSARALMRFLKNGSSFFDDINTKDRQETRDDIIVESMHQTTQFLRSNYGDEPFEWRWEQLHKITLRPPFFGRAADNPDAPTALKLIVDNLMNLGPYPAVGDGMTINNGEYSWNDPYNMILGPSIRRIIDFSDLSRTLSIIPTGQSENPLSQFYGDQTESWLNDQYKFLYQDSTFFNENQFKTMKLLPQ